MSHNRAQTTKKNLEIDDVSKGFLAACSFSARFSVEFVSFILKLNSGKLGTSELFSTLSFDAFRLSL
ncbi:hypothetical protein BpHYR1_022462 [Brachionus plicatilis]|uniref:Uncharacterized protein n=1 Tax=Brachionus plicatilis TaxID=10195 RepID=A0A3M7R1A5_BRAPC|nr:hypothetical protein BpHYR1_022462 [Brachionus plicatilis]